MPLHVFPYNNFLIFTYNNLCLFRQDVILEKEWATACILVLLPLKIILVAEKAKEVPVKPEITKVTLKGKMMFSTSALVHLVALKFS